MGTTVTDLSLVPSDAEPVIDLLLPQDLITEILLYLPVKSLVKFKCVSKPWLSLISSSRFINSHLATSSSSEGQYSNHQLLFIVDIEGAYPGIQHCFLSDALHNPCTNVSHIEIPPRDLIRSPWIVGIVNGLVCFSIGKDELYLWNPILRKSKRLPSSNFSLKDHSEVVYGFGYNESNDDYKVVQVWCVYPTRETNGIETKMKVYSLRDDLWRTGEDFKGGIPFYTTKYLNGKIWWNAMETSGNIHKMNMVSLDMATEKFEQVQGPFLEDNAYVSRLFAVLGGRLYLLCFVRGDVDMWEMTKFGVEESWSKTCSVPDNVFIDDPSKRYSMQNVLFITGNGEIVLEGEWGNLLVYNPNDDEFRKIQLDGLGFVSRIFLYAESLVSPDGP